MGSKKAKDKEKTTVDPDPWAWAQKWIDGFTVGVEIDGENSYLWKADPSNDDEREPIEVIEPESVEFILAQNLIETVPPPERPKHIMGMADAVKHGGRVCMKMLGSVNGRGPIGMSRPQIQMWFRCAGLVFRHMEYMPTGDIRAPYLVTVVGEKSKG